MVDGLLLRAGAALARVFAARRAAPADPGLEDALEARRRAEAASEAKSRFLATVSHEVRTPLNGILGMAELLADSPLDREQRAYVEAVRSSGRALATLIDEILDFSRIEAGRLELQAAPVELAGLVEGVVELLAPRAGDKGIEIAALLEPGLPAAAVGDAGRLRQVLTNLAGNAVKFTEAGGVGVAVEPCGEGRVRFSVSDTGPGIPAGRREAVFREFEQADGTTARRHGGTGLGLAISRRLVELMGGRLTLEDRPGGGSVFAFDVPMPAADPARPRPDLGGRRALVVAGGPFGAPYLAALLRGCGAEVDAAARPEDALRRLGAPGAPDPLSGRSRRGADQDARAAWEPSRDPHPEGNRRIAYDLLFVDCALGATAAERLAGAARAAGIPRSFLLFSPYERRAFGQALVGGFEGWLVKPLRAASLAARLAGAPAPRAVRHEPRPRPSRRGLRVLLAEDNEINTLVAMNFLGRLGAQVAHAADGAAALALAAEARRGAIPSFDVVLMDVSMPTLDGREATRRLRQAERAEGAAPVRVVALTAHASAEDRALCLAAGMDDVLTKPLELAALGAALRPGPPELRAAG